MKNYRRGIPSIGNDACIVVALSLAGLVAACSAPSQRAPARASPAPVSNARTEVASTGAKTSVLVTRIDTVLTLRVDTVVRSALTARNAPGAAVAILRHDTLLVAAGYGVADRERALSITPETIFQIGSATKPFTASAVLLLVEDGRIDLDAPAAQYLAWLPKRYELVTVRQLLTHTSGVAPDMRRANVDEISIEEFRRRFVERPASFPAGTSWQYANAGFTLASEVVTSASGQEFGSFLQRRIFGPLAMRATGYRIPEQVDDRHAVGYDLVEGELVRAPHVFSGWGNSGIETTVLDLAKWASALEHGALLRPESYRAMVTPARLSGDTAVNFPFGDSRSSYGLGWFLTSYRGAKLITHGGAIAGFSSVINRFPEYGVTIIVLSNGKQGPDRLGQADGISRLIADAIGIGASH